MGSLPPGSGQRGTERPRKRPLRAWLLAGSALFVVANACGTDARGVDDCRDIEEARCSAAAACGVIDDVAACQRFYRDQCLHGLSVDPPGKPVLDACVRTILEAGDCARASSDERPDACRAFGSPAHACSFIARPQSRSECGFLSPDEVPSEGGSGSGGDAGAAGQSSSPGAGSGGTPSTGEGGANATGGSAGAAHGGSESAGATGGSADHESAGAGAAGR